MTTQTRSWLDFAIQQMAAESYLDRVGPNYKIADALRDGNNDTRFVQPDANGDLPGKP